MLDGDAIDQQDEMLLYKYPNRMTSYRQEMKKQQ